MNLLAKLFLLHLFFSNIIISQDGYFSSYLALPMNRLFYNFENYINENAYSNNRFNISYNYNEIINNGHPNLDNSSELYAPGRSTRLISARLSYSNSWMIVELEPYQQSNNKLFSTSDIDLGTFHHTNNHGKDKASNHQIMGFRQSQLVLHYKGIGLGYGRLNHWWGPGFHSSITLSSNAPSQKTYSIGTFKDISFGNAALGAKIITIPYTSSNGTELYFSGLKTRMTFHSDPKITLQFHRTFLSGNFNSLNVKTNFEGSWSIEDATRLVIEPLFGQSKRNLDYTIPGTPGFDPWDEIISGSVELFLLQDDLNLYLEVASDDSRGNFTDLIAHWDHTLGLIIGGRKYHSYGEYKFFIGGEYLSTKVSNTYNPIFYRGNPNGNIYYAYEIYDYFSYKGRRMGAHSGSNSDDLIILLGYGNKEHISYLSFNKERHGLKSMMFPELKTEIAFTHKRNITKHHSIFLTFEYEKIDNFGFIQDDFSISRVLWVGYSFKIN